MKARSAINFLSALCGYPAQSQRNGIRQASAVGVGFNRPCAGLFLDWVRFTLVPSGTKLKSLGSEDLFV